MSQDIERVEDEEGVSFPGGLKMELFCNRHREPYERLNLNTSVAGAKFLEAVLMKLHPESKEAFADLLVAISKKPLCCHLSDDEHESLLADAIPSTGDEREDEDAVEANVEGVQRIKPDDPEYVRIIKKSKDHKP